MIKVKNIYKSFNQTNVLNNISADFEKAKTNLGWRQKTSFQKLVEIMVEFDLNEQQ